jgi:hypothetical protein
MTMRAFPEKARIDTGAVGALQHKLAQTQPVAVTGRIIQSGDRAGL